MKTKLLATSTSVLLTFAAIDVHAYVGPGLGAGAIGMILGVIASIGLAVFAIFWYPIKRLLKKRRKDDTDVAVTEEVATAAAEDQG